MLFQIRTTVGTIFLLIEFIDLFKQFPAFFQVLYTVALCILFPYHLVLIGIGPQGRTITKVVLQLNVAMRYQELQHLFEQNLYYIFGFATAKVVDRTKIRPAHATEPHEVYVLLKGFFYFAAAINIINICIHQHF